MIPGRISELRSRFGSHLPAELADGWLCFDCGSEKRRLAPLPPNWDSREDQDLWFWCRAAVPVRARPGMDAACGGAPSDAEPTVFAAEDEPAAV